MVKRAFGFSKAISISLLGNAFNLDVHLQCGNAFVPVPATLKSMSPKVVFVTQNVGQYRRFARLLLPSP